MGKRRAAVCLFFVLLPAVCAAVGNGEYDGRWWQSKSKEERTGFLAGYIDCAVYDRGDSKLADASWNLLEPEVTKYYQSQPARAGEPVSTVVKKVAYDGRKGSGKPQRGAMHGIFDGDYWRQSSDEHRRGFVSGYLECRRGSLPKNTTFSRDSDRYVQRISDWYGVKADDPSEIDEKKMPTKIATVIFMLRDPAPKSSPRCTSRGDKHR